MTAQWWWALGIVLALLFFAVYLSSTAGRLDRLHHRAESGLAALDAQLMRRASRVEALALSGLLDPVTGVLLADSAERASEAEGGPVERSFDESALTAVLGAVFGDRAETEELRQDPECRSLIDSVAASCHKVEMSRRFYNDTVRATRAVRSQRFVRWFHLAGHAPEPQTVELDDAVPAAFARL